MLSIDQSIRAVADLTLLRKSASKVEFFLQRQGYASLAEIMQELYERRCLTLTEISQLLRINRNTAWRWIEQLSIAKFAPKRALVRYALGDCEVTRRFAANGERSEERFIVPDRELLWLLGFALGDGNVAFYPESGRSTLAPEFAVFNKEHALIVKAFNVMQRCGLNPIEFSYHSPGKFGNEYRMRRVRSDSFQANFWKVKAQSALLATSLLTTRSNKLRRDTLAQIFCHATWIGPFVQGFFDAEGRIPRGVGRRRQVPNVSVFNTDFELMSWVHTMLNDGLKIRTSSLYGCNYQRRNGVGKSYSIDITGKWAVQFINEVGFSHPIKLKKGKSLLDWNRS